MFMFRIIFDISPLFPPPAQNLPRDALPDGSPVREKLATLKRPKKYKTSENDYSHGSFFLRIGAIGFGLGTLIYNGMELGSFFEIPWRSHCYQVLRGINPILQAIFTFSQMYFVFMNARVRQRVTNELNLTSSTTIFFPSQ